MPRKRSLNLKKPRPLKTQKRKGLISKDEAAELLVGLNREARDESETALEMITNDALQDGTIR